MKRVTFKSHGLDNSFKNYKANDTNNSSEEDQEEMSDDNSDESNLESEAEEIDIKVVKLKKPTNFQFVSLRNAKEFDTLWAKATSSTKKETLDKMVEIIRKPDDSKDKIFEEFEGEKTITFKIKDKKADCRAERQRKHIEERQSVRRSPNKMMQKFKKRTICKKRFQNKR